MSRGKTIMRLCVVHDDVNLDDVVWMLQTRLQTSWSAWANQAIDQVEEASVNPTTDQQMPQDSETIKHADNYGDDGDDGDDGDPGA